MSHSLSTYHIPRANASFESLSANVRLNLGLPAIAEYSTFVQLAFEFWFLNCPALSNSSQTATDVDTMWLIGSLSPQLSKRVVPPRLAGCYGPSTTSIGRGGIFHQASHDAVTEKDS